MSNTVHRNALPPPRGEKFVPVGQVFYTSPSDWVGTVHTLLNMGLKSSIQQVLRQFLLVFFTIFSFGFPTSITTTSNTVSLSVTHLNNQLYGKIKNLQFIFLIHITFCIAICINIDICIRRIKGYCYICYNPIQTTESATTQASWGIS